MLYKHRDYKARLCKDYPNLPKIVRTPVIPGFNDSVQDIEAILAFLKGMPNVSYEILPYHSFGKGKYKALGREYDMGDAKLDSKVMEKIWKEVMEKKCRNSNVFNAEHVYKEEA